ncbi:MAG: protein kinase domain-containing protein [Gemmatimonadota bacterium]
MNHPVGGHSPQDTLAERLQMGLGDAWRIERELGGGGMSRVFVAHDTALGRSVVVKVLREDVAEGISRERFRREVLVSANLQHPNVVGVIAAGDAAGVPYFVMPFVDGESLRARIRREGPLPLANAVAIMRDVARALAFAHARGIVHRDIKPDNVLLAGGAASVADFGVAKALASARSTPEHQHGTLTGAGISLGTPAYMAPEQVAGDPLTDHRADIYSLGATAYEMLTGSAPFGRRSLAGQLSAQLVETPAALESVRRGIPVALRELVERCLEKDPTRRPQSADDILAVLDDPGMVSGEVTSSASRSMRSPVVRARRRWTVIVGAAVAAAIGAIALSQLGGVGGSPGEGAAMPGTTGVAVFPLVSLSADSTDAFVAAGMTEALINALVPVPGLRIAARTAIGQELQAGQMPLAIAQKWGAAMYMEGTLQRSGERLRVTLRLVNVADGFTLWSDVYEREGVDLLTAQSEIAAAVAEAFRAM